jgi:hypothetical protein
VTYHPDDRDSRLRQIKAALAAVRLSTPDPKKHLAAVRAWDHHSVEYAEDLLRMLEEATKGPDDGGTPDLRPPAEEALRSMARAVLLAVKAHYPRMPRLSKPKVALAGLFACLLSATAIVVWSACMEPAGLTPVPAAVDAGSACAGCSATRRDSPNDDSIVLSCPKLEGRDVFACFESTTATLIEVCRRYRAEVCRGDP